MLVWLRKICFGSASLHNFAMGSKRHNNDVHLQKKSNEYDLTAAQCL
jgi:hypothetical protein